MNPTERNVHVGKSQTRRKEEKKIWIGLFDVNAGF